MLTKAASLTDLIDLYLTSCRIEGKTRDTIRVTDVGGNRPLMDYRLYDTMLGCLNQVRLVLRMMNPYVIS